MQHEYADMAHESPGGYAYTCADERTEATRARADLEPTWKFRGRGGIPRNVKGAMRAYARGHSIRAASRAYSLAPDTLRRILSTPTGRRYLARYRDRLDASRVLQGASVGFMMLAHAIQQGVSARMPGPREGEADADGA